MKLADRLKRATYLAALPAASLLTAVVVPVSAAHAQSPAATMTVLTPKQNETLGTTRFNLDVRFKSLTNAPVVTAELWVDGVRWVRRDLDSPRRASVLSFLVDGSTLSGGAHTIVVKVLNADGDVSSAKVNVVAGSDDAMGEAAWGGPEVRFVNPGNGKKIVGSVELLVEATTRNGRNPYVTFYVDDKFKTLKNYPPYSFVWDSTTETNGVHTITASGYLDSTNVTTTRKITVYVNNPGGNTKRMSEIPDLSAQKSATVATVAKPLSIPLPKRVESSIQMPTGEAHVATGTAMSVSEMDTLGLTATSTTGLASKSLSPRLAAPKAPVFIAKPVAKAAVVAITSAVVAPTSTITPTVPGEATLSVASQVASITEQDTIANLASVEFLSPRVSAATPRLARPIAPVAQAVRKTTVARPMPVASAVPTSKTTISLPVPVAQIAKPVEVKPVVTTVMKSVAPVVSIEHAKPVVMSVAAPKAKLAQRTDSMKPIQVAFDGDRIAFDVAPRVESGMPVAPFRQIFEHTGGTVSWTNDTKTMRAVNSDREIVIGVGKKTATVNGTKISMDRSAVLDRGRTVVPLNFVGKALDVNVQYDPATGRLTITSKK